MLSPHPAKHQQIIAILMVVATTLMFAILDATIKFLGAFISVLFMLWLRYCIQIVLMASWLGRRRGTSGFRCNHPGFQALRGGLMVLSSGLGALSVQYVPLAEFTAIMMLSPIVITAISGWIFREPVGRLRWVLAFGGFVGALLIVRPGGSVFGPAALLPVLTMLSVTAYTLLTGRLAKREDPYTTQFYSGVSATLLLTPFVLLQTESLGRELENFTWAPWLALAILGVLGTFSHLMLVMAFGRASTASLMPFTYAHIAFAMLLGWVVFQQIPDTFATLGIFTITACGIATGWLNTRYIGLPRSTANPSDRVA